MRILSIQLKRIGDLILTAPTFAALREAHPDAELVAVVQGSVASLARECIPALDQVYAWPSLGVLPSVVFGEWDLTLDFTGTDRSAGMSWLSRADVVRGYEKFASKKWRKLAYSELCGASVRELHTVDFHLALAGLPRPTTPSFRVPAVKTPELPTNYAVVHIGTAREEKFWTMPGWVEVIEHLVRDRNTPVVLTGTNAGIERAHLDLLRSWLNVKVTDLTGKLTLVQTAKVVAHAKLALGVDSMAMHLAAMYERPQVVLFGPTNPHHWRPLHSKAITLAAGNPDPVTNTRPKAAGAPMELISTAQVMRAIESLQPN
ncbi:MAG: glycosyltransferase family 9 protein [Verrucomicrobiaceae bacterium]|nr:glycosyltransferase family 9 protein [Verrucomicrobiaceae bacterium]